MKERLKKALEAKNFEEISKCLNVLRFRGGLNYQGILEYINEAAGTPMDLPEYETLLQECF